MLNPWRLRLLCQLETLGTVRAVAAAASQSASSVSQQLAVLEAEAGVPLLERTGRRVRLTPAGHLVAQRGRDILDRLAETEGELRALRGEPSGIVRVAAFQSAIHSFVLPTVFRLGTSHPNVEIHVHELEPHESTSAVLSGDVELAITTTDFLDVPRHADLHLIPLANDPIVLIAPLGHRVGDQDQVDLASLADEKWTFDVPGSFMSNLAIRLCRDAGFEPHVGCRFNNYLITGQHVANGGSIALLPRLAVDSQFPLLIRPLAPPVQRNVTAAVRRSSASSASVNLTLETLRETMTRTRQDWALFTAPPT